MDTLTAILIFYASVLCSFCNGGSKRKKRQYEYESSSREVDRNSFAEPSNSSNDSYTGLNTEVAGVNRRGYERYSFEEQGTGNREGIGDREHGGLRGIYDFPDSIYSSSRASSKDSVGDQGDNVSQKSLSAGNDDQGYRGDQGSSWSGPCGSQGSLSGSAGGDGGYSD